MIPPPPPGPPPNLGGVGPPPPTVDLANSGPTDQTSAPAQSAVPGAVSDNRIPVWEKAWTPADMRGSISTWTLAADSGVLLYLKDFSKRMTGRTAEITRQVDALVTETKRSEIRLQNVFNDFLMLSCVQFVENRVYDFEETKDGDHSAASGEDDAKSAGGGESKPTAEKEVEEEKTREQHEAELTPRITTALKLGIQVMESAFEKVEVAPMSSSVQGDEDEDDEERENAEGLEALLVPKDPYLLRPLPHIIGSAQFTVSDDVGLLLAESEEEEEEEEEEEVDSECEEDDDGDDEDDAKTGVSGAKSIGAKVSPPDEDKDDGDSDSNEDNDDWGGDDNVANEKLLGSDVRPGRARSMAFHVAPEEDNNEIAGAGASGQPVKNVVASTGAVASSAGGSGVFGDTCDSDFDFGNDDDEDNDTDTYLPGSRKSEGNKQQEATGSLAPKEAHSAGQEGGVPAEKLAASPAKAAKSGRGLFDDADSAEDNASSEIFQEKPKLKEASNASSEAPVLAVPSKKKPVGAMSMFGGADLLGSQKIQDGRASNPEPALPVKNKIGGGGLFDDADDTDDDFDTRPQSKVTPPAGSATPAVAAATASNQKKLAGAVSAVGRSDVLTGQKRREEPVKQSDPVKKKKTGLGGGLFGDDTDDDDDDIMSAAPTASNAKPSHASSAIGAAPLSAAPSTKKTTGLFDDDDDDDDAGDFGGFPHATALPVSSKPDPMLFKPKATPALAPGLFDDGEDDDMFAVQPKTKSAVKEAHRAPAGHSTAAAKPGKTKPDSAESMAGGADLLGTQNGNRKPVKKAAVGGGGLFGGDDGDDDDDDMFAVAPTKTKPKASAVAAPGAKAAPPIAATPPTKKGNGLFDDDDDDAHSFGGSRVVASKPVLPKPGPGAPTPVPAQSTAAAAKAPGLFDDSEDDDMFAVKPKVKKFGAVSMFGGAGRFDPLKGRADSHATDENFPQPARRQMPASSRSVTSSASPKSSIAPAASFDEPVAFQTLPSATKNRAKGPSRRRPQRQTSLPAAATENSAADLAFGADAVSSLPASAFSLPYAESLLPDDGPPLPRVKDRDMPPTTGADAVSPLSLPATSIASILDDSPAAGGSSAVTDVFGDLDQAAKTEPTKNTTKTKKKKKKKTTIATKKEVKAAASAAPAAIDDIFDMPANPVNGDAAGSVTTNQGASLPAAAEEPVKKKTKKTTGKKKKGATAAVTADLFDTGASIFDDPSVGAANDDIFA